mgnify:CR=1 FL=1
MARWSRHEVIKSILDKTPPSAGFFVRMDQPDSASVPFITQTPAARAWCFDVVGAASDPASGLTGGSMAFSNHVTAQL